MNHWVAMSNETIFRHASEANDDGQSMAQIREILFGEHGRQTAAQIAKLAAEFDEREQTLQQRLDKQIEGAIAALRADLDKQGLRQQTALDGLDNALRALLTQTDERLALLDSDQQESHHALRQAIDQQGATMEQLERQNIARTELAELLEGIAQQLRKPNL